jgi:hypothetical protein
MRPCQNCAELDSFREGDFGYWRPSQIEEVEVTRRRAIDMIWVLRKHRGGGEIAMGLVRALGEHCGLAIEEFAHETPFTAAAVRFWSRQGLSAVFLT